MLFTMLGAELAILDSEVRNLQLSLVQAFRQLLVVTTTTTQTYSKAYYVLLSRRETDKAY